MKEKVETWNNMKNNTLNYYNINANSFVSSTLSVDFSQTQDKFLHLLQPHPSLILVVVPAGTRSIFWMRECKSMRRMDRKSCAG